MYETIQSKAAQTAAKDEIAVEAKKKPRVRKLKDRLTLQEATEALNENAKEPEPEKAPELVKEKEPEIVLEEEEIELELPVVPAPTKHKKTRKKQIEKETKDK
jgi:hypothetical protein